MSDYVSDWKDPIEIARLKDVISMLKAENESLRAVLIGNAEIRDGAGYCDTRDIPGMAPARMDSFIDDAMGQGEQS